MHTFPIYDVHNNTQNLAKKKIQRLGEKMVPTFQEFLTSLDSGKSKKRGNRELLIGQWDNNQVKGIELFFAKIWNELKFTKPKDFSRKKSNQSLGNIYEIYLLDIVNKLSEAQKRSRRNINFNEFILSRCKGKGYPDCILSAIKENVVLNHAVEIKATSKWNEKDANRRVLLSSTSKLKRNIADGNLTSPTCHLLVTLIYDIKSGEVLKLRIDFLQPNFPISSRLEGSTSHKALEENSKVRRIFELSN
jgi:hypothetical protein